MNVSNAYHGTTEAKRERIYSDSGTVQRPNRSTSEPIVDRLVLGARMTLCHMREKCERNA